MYYYEQRNSFGKFTPRKSPNKPDGSLPEGRRVKIRNVNRIPQQWANATLSNLQIAMGEGSGFVAGDHADG